MENVTVKSVNFFNEKCEFLKDYEFESPVNLDSKDFNDVTPIQGYAWCQITNEENSDIVLDYKEVPCTYKNLN
jgi:hypothetical protein